MDMSSMDMSTMGMNNEIDIEMDMDMDMDMDMSSMDMSTMDMSMDSLNKFSLFAMPMDGNWTVNDFIVMNLMWIIMMFAMMFPSSLMFLFSFLFYEKQHGYCKEP